MQSKDAPGNQPEPQSAEIHTIWLSLVCPQPGDSQFGLQPNNDGKVGLQLFAYDVTALPGLK